MLGEDRIEAGRGQHLRCKLFIGHREPYNLRPWKDTAQDGSRFDAGQHRHAQVEEDQITVELPGLLDRGDRIAHVVANSVGAAGLKEEADGAAHGGAVVDDEDSRCVPRHHGRENYYGCLRKTIRIYVFPCCVSKRENVNNQIRLAVQQHDVTADKNVRATLRRRRQNALQLDRSRIQALLQAGGQRAVAD